MKRGIKLAFHVHSQHKGVLIYGTSQVALYNLVHDARLIFQQKKETFSNLHRCSPRKYIFIICISHDERVYLYVI